jgi:hypothetical protein
VFEGNVAISAAQHHRRDFDPPSFIRALGSLHLYERGANLFPLFLKHMPESGDLFSSVESSPVPNLSDSSRAYLSACKVEPLDLLFHVLAFSFSGLYIRQNAFVLRQDWPRIPLPAKKKALLGSAALGRRVAALLDTEKPVDGVTCGKIDPRLRNLGSIRKVGGGQLDSESEELDLTAGWGHAGQNGVCMPGRGKTEEREASEKEQSDLPGNKTLDIYLNDVAYWSNVPKAVWEYTIGGYQVIKKWLSYRDKTMLGRGLTPKEAGFVTEMVRRIAALILLQPELDANYQTVKADTWPWPEA